MILFFLVFSSISINDDVESETNESLELMFNNISVKINESVSPLGIDLKNSKILLISDFHIGKKYDPQYSIDVLFKQIHALIKQEFPDYVFILGDVVDGTCPSIVETYRDVLVRIIKLSMKCIIFGGNHDRYVVDMFLKRAKLPTNLVVLTNKRYLVLPTQPRIFIGHDWYFNVRVRDDVTLTYMKNLRNLTLGMNESDYLIIGHTHTQIHDENKTSYSIGQFSVDEHSLKYAVITTSNSKPRITLETMTTEL